MNRSFSLKSYCTALMRDCLRGGTTVASRCEPMMKRVGLSYDNRRWKLGQISFLSIETISLRAYANFCCEREYKGACHERSGRAERDKFIGPEPLHGP
jgi:hypothetical protein